MKIINQSIKTYDYIVKTKLHVIPRWKAFLKDKSAHMQGWKVFL